MPIQEQVDAIEEVLSKEKYKSWELHGLITIVLKKP